MVNLSRIFILIGVFSITLVTGIFLHKSTDTYNSIIFTAHKLGVLAFSIFSVKTILSIMKVSDTGSIVNVFIVIGALSIIVLFVTGIIMSINKSLSYLLPLVHIVTTFILVFVITVIISRAFKNDLFSR